MLVKLVRVKIDFDGKRGSNPLKFQSKILTTNSRKIITIKRFQEKEESSPQLTQE